MLIEGSSDNEGETPTKGEAMLTIRKNPNFRDMGDFVSVKLFIPKKNHV